MVSVGQQMLPGAGQPWINKNKDIRHGRLVVRFFCRRVQSSEEADQTSAEGAILGQKVWVNKCCQWQGNLE